MLCRKYERPFRSAQRSSVTVKFRNDSSDGSSNAGRRLCAAMTLIKKLVHIEPAGLACRAALDAT